MTDSLIDEDRLVQGRGFGPGIGHVQNMITFKVDHPADVCGVGLPGCSHADEASWPEPPMHRRLSPLDEFRAERIRLACAEGRPEVPGAQPTP